MQCVTSCFQKMSRGTDDVQSVTCTIKPAVYLHIGDAKTDSARSGVCVVDVSLPFGKPVNVSCRNLNGTSGIHDNHHMISHLHALLSSTV